MEKGMLRQLITLLLAVSAAQIPSHAQHTNEKDAPCAGVVVTADLSRCLSRARDSADAKLHAAYNQIHDKLETADAQRLTAAERSWIQYRDANCSAERELYAGGTASAPAHLACLEAMTRARTKELEIVYVVKMK
jgi:uncharacterized protein YecT (DUF1311 family)